MTKLGLEPNTQVVRRSEHDQADVDDGTVRALGHWRYAGRGNSPGRALFAHTIAKDLTDEHDSPRKPLEKKHSDSWLPCPAGNRGVQP
jgi:hypothetical protein